MEDLEETPLMFDGSVVISPEAGPDEYLEEYDEDESGPPVARSSRKRKAPGAKYGDCHKKKPWYRVDCPVCGICWGKSENIFQHNQRFHNSSLQPLDGTIANHNANINPLRIVENDDTDSEDTCISQDDDIEIKDENFPISLTCDEQEEIIRRDCSDIFTDPIRRHVTTRKSPMVISCMEGIGKNYIFFNDSFKSIDELFKYFGQNMKSVLKDELELHKSLKVLISLECLFMKGDESCFRTFKTQSLPVYFATEVDKFINEGKLQIISEIEECILDGGGWVLGGLKLIEIHTSRFKPLRGSSYIPLPPKIANKKAVINVRNEDQNCFMYAVLAPKLQSSNKFDPKRYTHVLNLYDWTDISFPTQLQDIPKFEQRNNMSINVFGLDEKDNVYPLKVADPLSDHRDLLLLTDNGGSHYCYITNFNRLVSSQYSKAKTGLLVCKRCFKHFLLKSPNFQQRYKEHESYCNVQKMTKIILPRDKRVVFSNFRHRVKVPFVVYCCFEKVLLAAGTQSSKKHEPISWAVNVVSDWKNFPRKMCRGPNAPEKLIDYLQQISVAIKKTYNNSPAIPLTHAEIQFFDSTNTCFLCNCSIEAGGDKVRYNDQITGKFRGVAHNKCKLQSSPPDFLPIVMHNFGYNEHIIIRELGCNEHIILDDSSFSKNVIDGLTLRFINSSLFLSKDLEELTDSLPKSKCEQLSMLYSGDQLNLLPKNAFPSDYIDSWEKLDAKLPPSDKFYDQKICDLFQINTLGEYSDLCLKTQVLVLSDVFENFRTLCHNSYALDPVWYFSSTALAWDAMLKVTKVKLELLSDLDMILMVEKGVRGGVVQCSYRHSEANNKYMETFNKDSKYIINLEANSLFAHTMTFPLPTGGFEWFQPHKDFDIKLISDNSEFGYILEVDIGYPSDLHNQHNDLPFLPVKTAKSSSIEKVMTTLEPKKNYVVHYVALKQALEHGLILDKIHRVIKFKQSKWLSPFIELNSQKLKDASNDFDRDFFQLMSNAAFDKTLKNVRNVQNLHLVDKSAQFEKLVAQPTFGGRTIYTENLALVAMGRENLVYNQPVVIGMSILDLSKTLMYHFHYDKMMKWYGRENIKLLYTDTNSLIYEIKTTDLYEDIKVRMDEFDTSSFPPNSQLCSNKNKNVPGKFKLNNQIISEFVGLKSKMYCVRLNNGEENKCLKGIQKRVVDITFEDYKTSLMTHTQNYFPKMNTNCYSQTENQLPLCSLDDKRIILKDGVNTAAWGHYMHLFSI